jgi:hypothetical protein
MLLKGVEERNGLPPDMQVVWSLLKGKLNVKKTPPYPPKKTKREVTGLYLVKRHPPVLKKSTDEKSRRGEKKKPNAVEKDTTGFLSSVVPT